MCICTILRVYRCDLAVVEGLFSVFCVCVPSRGCAGERGGACGEFLWITCVFQGDCVCSRACYVGLGECFLKGFCVRGIFNVLVRVSQCLFVSESLVYVVYG